MPRLRLSVLPVLSPLEICRDLSSALAESVRVAEIGPCLRRILSGPCLDLLWSSDTPPEAEELVERLRELRQGDVEALLFVALSAAEEAFRGGAPLAEACRERLRLLVQGEALRTGEDLLVAFDDRTSPALGWIGSRSETLRLHHAVRQLADPAIPVLLAGETGTGKEVVARGLHRFGQRRERPWVAVNCAELPEAILESELFGHARGAFTGAIADRPGLFEAAADGTIFLDEIGELPAAAQAKLLRVLEDHRVRRLGTSTLRPLQCRVVAATNRDLAAALEGGGFRRDLFYRLRGVEIRLPPLRERPGDVLALARAFLVRARLRFRKGVVDFSEEAALALLAHPWPGNVRELRMAVEAAVLAAEDSRIQPKDLALVRPAASADTSPEELSTVAAVERAHILRALASTAGNKMAAARLLGLSRQSLDRRIERHRIELPPELGRFRPRRAGVAGRSPGEAPQNSRGLR
jgi:transcriptional regulator with PAS, ATPase and Fis domain